MTALFEDGLVDRLQQQWPRVDVHLVAKNVEDMTRRKRVRNPNALLVHSVRDAAAKLDSAAQTHAADHSREQLRYAAFMAELMRRISQDGLRPVDVALAMRNGIVSGFPRLNPLIVDLLEAMGSEWKKVG